MNRHAIVSSWVAACMLCSSACASRASEPSSSEPPAIEQPRPPPGPPPLDQYGAEELYKDQRFAEAAWVFAEIVAGRLSTSVSVPQAEYWLGKSLYQLGDYPRSLEVFSKIARDEDHEYRLVTLAWLATLTRQLPDQALEAMLHVPISMIDDENLVEIRDHLAYLYGAWHVQHGDHELGVRLLDEVPPNSDYRSLARFELAQSNWRTGHQQVALSLYREVVDHWIEERRTVKRLRDQPQPEHVQFSVERLCGNGIELGRLCGRERR